jgi:hypothetical protein
MITFEDAKNRFDWCWEFGFTFVRSVVCVFGSTTNPMAEPIVCPTAKELL